MRALMVGINKYPDSPLRGCVNDVLNLRQVLIANRGFSVLSVKTLFDHSATKERILEELRNLVRGAVTGSHLLFHFSGHGTQVPDKDRDESDFMDEVICPADFSWSNYITDDDLYDIFKSLHPEATLDVVLDCCHSGTGLRDCDALPRGLTYPGEARGFLDIFSFFKKRAELPNVALFSGCKANQTSADALIDRQYQGAMTHALVTTLKPPYRPVTRSIQLTEIRRLLARSGFEQTPQLECPNSLRTKIICT